jgi:hypothetical protein
MIDEAEAPSTLGLGGLKHEDDPDASALVGAAALLGQDLPGLQHGEGSFALAADAGAVAVDLVLPLRERWPLVGV